MSDDTSTSATNATPTGSTRQSVPRAWLWLVVAFVVVAAAVVGIGLGLSGTSSSATITVSGSSTVRGTPDTVSFNIGVTTVGPNALAALGENNQKVKALEKALSANGVTKRDMQTSGLNIYENTNNTGAITGFTVNDTLDVTMHNLKKVGVAIDAAASAAGNGVELSGITFSISNDSSLLASARAKAMRNARRAADELAQGGGTSVTSIVRVTDVENQVTPVTYGLPSAATSFKASSVPVETGTQPVTVQVTVVYSLAS